MSSRSNLAAALNAQGKHAEAERELWAALAVWERMFGKAHPHYFRVCFSLAAVLKNQGKDQEALGFAWRAEEGSLKVLGTGHPDSKDAKELREAIEQELQSDRALK